jgi:hypothetical protein
MGILPMCFFFRGEGVSPLRAEGILPSCFFCSFRSMGILPMCITGVSPVSCRFYLPGFIAAGMVAVTLPHVGMALP